MKLQILTVFLFSVYSLFAQTDRLSEQIGNVQKTSTIKGGYAFELTDAFVSITAYSPTTLRFRITKEKPVSDFSFAVDSLSPSSSFTKMETKGDIIYLQTDSLKVAITKTPFRVSIYDNAGAMLCADDTSLGVSWWGNQVECYKKLNADEKFIGLGEKTGDINRRDQFYQNWNGDNPAYALDKDPLYATIPFFIGIHDKVCYGIFFDNSHHSFFNFGGGADEEFFHFGADDGEMNYYFFGGSSIQKIIYDYTSLTGRTPMPPMWSLGFQQSRWGYVSQHEVIRIAQTFREKQIPCDVMVSDIQYMDQHKVFTWDPQNFATPKVMLDSLKQIGFDMVTIIDPGIKVEKGYPAYDEAFAKSLFAKYPDGQNYVGHVWPGACNFPDFTRAETRDWWGTQFKTPLVDIGVKGFWNDMNEPAAWGREFPNLIEFGEGKNKATLYTVKNAYGLMMARATYEGTKKLLNGERPFVLTRASYSGVQKYSAQWTGDNASTDAHMLLGFRLLNSMGVSGIPYVGMDIGGFIGNPSPELFLRWVNLAEYSPLFRNHTEIDYSYREPWLLSNDKEPMVKKMIEDRYKLLPYLYSSFYEAHENGMPINRMLPVNYTYDDNVYDTRFENEFLHGSEILVCPVESTKDITHVYLPDSSTEWYRLSTGVKYSGGVIYNVDAPIDDAPVFVKAGAIVPMQCVIQNTKEKGDGVLYVNVWYGKSANSFLYYEDDGHTYNYEKGDYYKRLMSFDPVNKKIILNKKEGSFNSRFSSIQFVLHGFGGANNFEINDKAVKATADNKNILITTANNSDNITLSW
jgi:alpha-glucosidase